MEREKRSHKKREEKLEILLEAALACKTGTKKYFKKLHTIQNTKHALIVEAPWIQEKAFGIHATKRS